MQDNTPDPEGQRRIAQLVAKALKSPVTKKEYQMPKDGQTRTVKAIKEANAKARAKRTQEQPPEVVQQAQPQTVDNSGLIQPKQGETTTSEGCTEHMNKGYIEDIKESSLKRFNTVLNNQEVIELVNAGVREADIDDHLDVVLAAYRAEGLTPKSSHLVAAILQLHKDVR